MASTSPAATSAIPSTRQRGPLSPDLYERLLAYGAGVLAALVVLALVRGAGRWGEMPAIVWVHLLTVSAALVLTPVQLLGRRSGDRHRVLGWIWALSMYATAVASFAIRGINAGGLSFIHIFSGIVLVAVPLLVWSARNRQVARHRRVVRGLVTGALLTAGYFTLLPERLLGHWLFG